MHSPYQLSASKILNVMPTDKSIAEIYKRLTNKEKLSGIISDWGDAIVWSELHRTEKYPSLWN